MGLKTSDILWLIWMLVGTVWVVDTLFLKAANNLESSTPPLRDMHYHKYDCFDYKFTAPDKVTM